MTLRPDRRRDGADVPRRVILTLATGLAGGLAADWLGAPLPYLLGCIAAVALLQVATETALMPRRGRELGQLILGVAVGLYFTADAAAELSRHLPMMVAAAVASLGAAGLLALPLSRLGGVDRTTAYFASLPGGVSEMSVLAERFGGEPGLVAAAQTFRLTLIVFVLPIGFALIAAGPEIAGRGPEARAETLLLLVPVFGAGLVLAATLSRLRVMNSWFLGGLFAGAAGALSGSGIVLPGVAADAGQWLIGAALGARFHRSLLASLSRFLPLAVAGTLALIAFTIALAFAFSRIMPLDFGALVLATAPGGVAEMSIVATTLAMNVPAVTTFHLIRIFLIVLLSAPIYRAAARLSRQ